MENSVDPDKTAPIGALCSGSTLFPASLYNKLPRPGNPTISYIYILYIYYIQARVFKISQNDKLLSENHETTEKWPLCIQLHKMRYDCVIHRISNIVYIQF